MKRFLVISVALYLVCILTYEIGITLFFLYIIVAYYINNSILSAIRNASAFIICSVVIFIILLYVRSHIPNVSGSVEYHGLQIKMDFLSILKTFFVQLIAPLPLTYMFYSNNIFQPRQLQTFLANHINIYIIIIVFCKLCKDVLKINTNCDIQKFCWMPFLLGLCLSILPAIPVSFSSKYQNELRIGLGYLPVYIQSFGVMLCVSEILRFIYNKNKNVCFKKIFGIVFIVFILIGTCATYISNNLCIASANWYHYPQHILKESLRRKYLNNIEDNSTILFKQVYIYDISLYCNYWLSYFTGKNFECSSLSHFLEGNGYSNFYQVNPGNRAFYVLDFPPSELSNSYVKIGKMLCPDPRAGVDLSGKPVYVVNVLVIMPNTPNKPGFTHIYGETIDGYVVEKLGDGIARDSKYTRYWMDFGEKCVQFDSIKLF
jgi:hypothetical protein